MTTEEALRLLGVPEETALSQAAIDKARKKALLINHPDKGGNHEQFLRLEEAYATFVAKLCSVITVPDFNDPNVIEEYRLIENRGRHGDDLSRRIYETMRAFPGVAWPPDWPPAEDPVLTLVEEVSDGAVTSGVQEAAPKQEKKRKQKEEKNLEPYNNPGNKAKRRGRPPKIKKCDEEATTKRYKRPRGAAPKDKQGNKKKWCEMTGKWREAEALYSIV